MANDEVLETLRRIETKLDELTTIAKNAEDAAQCANTEAGGAASNANDVFFLIRDELLPLFDDQDD